MAKFTCPYCYGEHTLKDCKMQCSYNIVGTNVTCMRNVVKDANGWIPDSEKQKCLKCQGPTKKIFCNLVGQEMPISFLESTNLSISLLGAKASGKSNYIGVVIKELERNAFRFNCFFNIARSETSLRYYKKHYYEPLYESGQVIDATRSMNIPPMIFQLNSMNSKHHIDKTALITFYDTAGENLDDVNSMVVFNRYIPNSKGIILLMDPLQVPSVRKQLQGKMPLPPVNTDTAEILSRVITNIRDVKKKKKDPIQIPLALVFTKMDALEQHGILPPGSCLRDESMHLSAGAFVRSDYENTQIEMKALLENWLVETLNDKLNQFSKYSVFGLSALGAIPNGIHLSGDDIQPKRVLDPLLWILSENKFIKTVK